MTDQLSPEKPMETSQLSNLPNYLLTAREVAGILQCSAVQVLSHGQARCNFIYAIWKISPVFNNHFT